MMALSGSVGAVFIQTEDAPISFEDEPTVANESYTSYTIANEILRYWDKNSAVLVKVNGSPITQGFSVEYCGGVVVFQIPRSQEDVVTVSGMSLFVEQHGGFFNWSADLEMDTSDVTTFQSGGWKENLPTIKGFSASAEKYWGDAEFFSRLGQEVIVALYVNSSASQRRYEGYGIISSDGIETAVEEVINETIEIQGTGPLYYREG
ncbi:hypothetical protein JCM39194_10530 [Desulfotomaculum varum]